MRKIRIIATLLIFLAAVLPANPAEAGVRGPDAPDTVYFYLNDHLSTPRIVTNDMGQGVWRARYAPFGQRIRFPGQWDDGIEGVWYNWHRFYLPEYGLYGRVDPVFQVGAQVWDYVGGNPVGGIDPEGLQDLGSYTEWDAFGFHRSVGRAYANSTAANDGLGPLHAANAIFDALTIPLRLFDLDTSAWRERAGVDGVINKGSSEYATAFFWTFVAQHSAPALAALRAVFSKPLGCSPSPSGSKTVVAGKGSTGRTNPTTLKEQLAMEQVLSDPQGLLLDGVKMNDPRWLGGKGWSKHAQNVNGVEIHYVYNELLGLFDDFKFKD